MSTLVLTRQVGETLVIGDDVRIKVVEVRGSAVRLCIEAPRELPVVRSELLEGARR